MTTLIDLRSDTVTKPSAAMREAMATAEVGDDVFGDDPTVHALQLRAAELTGKEAALFVSSGTMGNLLAVLAQTSPGDEIIVGRESHIANWEQRGHARIGGVAARALPWDGLGELDLDEVRTSLRDDLDPHRAGTAMIATETSNGTAQGWPVASSHLVDLGSLAREHDLAFHVDGARVFNATVALGMSAAEYLAPADTVTFCLSKGLGAPIGSLLCGPSEVIARAHRARKLLGGATRQVGVIAAPGLVALSDGPDGTVARLADDHRNARRIADALAEMPGVVSPGGIIQPEGEAFDPARVRTNLVFFGVDDRVEDAAFGVFMRCGAAGIQLLPMGERVVRLVLNLGVGAEDVDRVIDALRGAVGVA